LRQKSDHYGFNNPHGESVPHLGVDGALEVKNLANIT